ncbi:MAG: glycoside hydrolase family 38 C-terminal domain-containing protein [Candidatus Aminicenantales bacterium]
MVTKKCVFRLAAACGLAALLLAPSGAGERRGRAGESSLDALEVPGRPAPALSFDVVPTVFFVRDGGGLKQLLTVNIENNDAPGAGELTVRLDARDLSFPLNEVPRGKSSFPVSVPEILKPVTAKFTIKAGGQAATKEVTLKPQRKWTVDLFHHSHTDIGYTELQSRVGQNHLEYLDSVIDYCRQTDSYPDDAKFRWNIEVSWAFEYYQAARPAAKVKELVDLIKAGRVELSGLQLNVSDCFAHEEIIRAVENPVALGRRYGFDVRSAMNDDVTGFGWALPQIFAQNGVRYFATGINETRSRAPLRRPNPFWWESPDGSRVLQWNGEHYLFGNYDLLLHEPLAKSSPKVGEYLAKLEARGDYPYDLIAFNISAWVTDNCPPGRALSDRVKEWNEKFAYPKLRLATLHEFFERLEKDYGPTIPVHKLGWPDYWTDGVASTAFETGLNRIAHNELVAAEKVSALAAKLDLDKDKRFRFPGDQIRETWDLSMLYDEHTWGAWNSIDDPQSELARGQWTLKSSFAYRAREASRTLLRRGTEALAKLISADGDYEFAVFNPLSWLRTDVVRVTLPAGPLREAKGNIRVIDRRLGSDAKFQMMGDDAILVVAGNVPSMGYAVFSVRPGAGGAPAAAGPEKKGTGPVPESVPLSSIENRFYRLTVDSKTGGISSLVDKETGRELVDKACPWPLNAYIYEQPEGGRKAVDDMTKRAVFRRWVAESAKVTAGWRGPVATSISVTSSPKMCRKLEQRIILYDDIKRIDLVNVLDKEETFDPEAVYFAYPFAVGPGPDVRFEISDADMAPGTEQLPGTTLDWHTVQNWVEFSGKDARVIWSPLEAPLVMFGDINIGKWLKTLDLKNARVFSYAMNNYWMTNFKASQEGRVEFRYSLTSLPPGPAAPDRVASSRFGWEVHTPLTTAWLAAKNKGRFTTPMESFVSVSQPNIIIQALWLDADGKPVVRLREIAGKATEARLSSEFLLGFSTAWQKGSSEQKEVTSIPVSLRPFEIKTVRVAIEN